ncbi:MAG TPA: twin-arginine translocase TatA/TatE family subunit [Pyrinomonadaceae bacterium]|jgi:TatA/E family protein of Tat protein translocase|nr:twin-arginine translocase TatA/TatE family subunit [Pyrinomonadaceae bacterium]
MHSLLFLEFIGTSELLVVLVVALIVFGPRKLPELGRSLGSAMRQFRDASDSFKRTWETEALMANSMVPALAPAADVSAEEPRPEPSDERDPEAAGVEGHPPRGEANV